MIAVALGVCLAICVALLARAVWFIERQEHRLDKVRQDRDQNERALLRWKAAAEGVSPSPVVHKMRRRGRDVIAHEEPKRGEPCQRCKLTETQQRLTPWSGCRPQDADKWLNGDGTPIAVSCNLCGEIGSAKSAAQAVRMSSDHRESKRHCEAQATDIREKAEQTQRAVDELRRRNGVV